MRRARLRRIATAIAAGVLRRARLARISRTIALWVLVSLLLIYALTWLPYPVDDLQRGFAESWRIYDRHGNLLREVVNAAGARSRWATLDTISENMVASTIAAEDSRFYQHGGVDGRAVLRAAWQNLSELRLVSGASTITMQMVRIHRGYGQRSLLGKLRQTLDAWRVERALSKREILEQYLNRAPYGAGTMGVEAASQRYFGKTNQHLSVAEAALLAALPRAPSQLSPLRNLSRAKARQRYVLDRMLAGGLLDEQTHRRAVAEPLALLSHPPDLCAIHFTDYVMSLEPEDREVHTTLDLDLQRPIQRLTRTHVESLESGGLTNAAVIVLENDTCEVLAMTGSVSYWDENAGAVNGVLARRQPGSALKPFVYALAFERDFHPASVLSDIPTLYPGGDGSLLRPRNYSERFVGPVLAKDALGRSLNVPAIRLGNALGIEDVLQRLREVGFSTLDRDAEHYGLGLTLGNGEVTLLELAQAYAMLSRGGISCTAKALIGQPATSDRRVFSEQATFLVRDILSDETLRMRAFGANNPLLFGYPVAVKTGTSSNWRDSIAVGFTDRFTVAVWSGDFSGKPMHELSGSVGAGPLFRHVIELLVGRGAIPYRPRAAEPPEGVEKILVCGLSGMAPTEHCPHQRELWVPTKRGGRKSCDWHRPTRIDKRNGLLASPKCPKRYVREQVFEHLPPRFAAWQAQHPHATRAPPTRFSPLCPQGGVVANAVVVTHPKPADVFLIEPGYPRDTQTVSFAAEVDPALPQVTWFVDGRRFATARWPYEIPWPLARGKHQVHVVAGTLRSEPVDIEVH